jgi:hypothetical protein
MSTGRQKKVKVGVIQAMASPRLLLLVQLWVWAAVTMR